MKIRNLAILFLVLFSTSGVAHGQSISPTALEFKGPKAKGFFTVSNAGTTPLGVTVEANSIVTSATGERRLSSETPNVTVNFKQPEFKLGPHAIHMVNFEATCTNVPCHFTVLANFTPLKHSEGLIVVEHLGAAVYVCDKQKNCRKNTLSGLGIAVGK